MEEKKDNVFSFLILAAGNKLDASTANIGSAI